jgi:hypothetical protein
MSVAGSLLEAVLPTAIMAREMTQDAVANMTVLQAWLPIMELVGGDSGRGILQSAPAG